MAMNLTRLSTTAGVDYLLNTIAPGDRHAPEQGGGLTGYYAQSGTPPGRWWGRGAQGAGIDVENTITGQGAGRLFKDFQHPGTGAELGARPRTSGATAGFDLTFTIPKAVSALWAIAPPKTQAAIMAAHQEAISQALTYVEDQVLQTRSGHGGVATVGVSGMIAGRFDHFDSREGDPHLHTHVVVSNRVQRALDGKWLTVDSRALHKAAVSISEVHQNLLLDELARTVGMEFTERPGATTRAVVPDVVGAPEALTDIFSTRDRQIRTVQATAEAEYAQAHGGRLPTGKALAKIHQRVWRDTRKPKDKVPASLAELRDKWSAQANESGLDTEGLVATATGRRPSPDLDEAGANNTDLAADYAAFTLEGFGAKHGQAVIDQVRATRSTWTMANLRAEAERLTRNVRCANPQVRFTMINQVVQAAMSVSVELSSTRYEVSPEASADVRLALRGRSVFDDDHARVFTDKSILDAEAYLMDSANTSWAPMVSPAVAAQQIAAASSDQLAQRGFAFAPDQRDAAYQVITDGRALSAIVGPAGTGKSTTMKAVKVAWESVHGPGSVTGLTTSAQAAAVLGAETGAEANTVAKWLYETTGDGAKRRTELLHAHQETLDSPLVSEPEKARARRAIAPLLARAEQWSMRQGQLIVIDEASMTGTYALAEVSRQAREAGAKVLLVGDPAQLDAVEAGGVLGWFNRTGHAVSLDSVWRFANDWESDASLRLRRGDESVIDTYGDHGRIRHGQDEQILEEVFFAARSDQQTGRSTIVVAATNDVAADLNQRFTLDRRANGEVSIESLTGLRGGANAGVGDVLLARKVDRTLRDSAGDFIRNGTQLTIQDISSNHVIAVRSDNNATITISRTWAAQHVELGYAITAHRAQGTTVDVGHVAIPSGSSMPRELLYVAMTRGRANNTAWVGEACDQDQAHSLLAVQERPGWRAHLEEIVGTSAAEQTAHEVREHVRTEYHSLSRLMAERAHMLSLAHTDSTAITSGMVHQFLTNHLGPDLANAAEASPRFEALTAELSRLHAHGFDPAPFTVSAAHAGKLASVGDPTAVLLWRIEAWGSAQAEPSGDLVQERDLQVRDPALHAALVQSSLLIDAQAARLVEAAHEQRWAKDLDLPARTSSAQALRAVAVYRDTYDVEGIAPLGAEPNTQDRVRWQRWNQAHELLDVAHSHARSEPARATSVGGPSAMREPVRTAPTLGL